MSRKKLVDAIANAVRQQTQSEAPSPIVYATWVGAEGVDAELSELAFPDGSGARFVPKLSHVASLSPGDSVMCINTNTKNPLTIIGKVVGNITLGS